MSMYEMACGTNQFAMPLLINGLNLHHIKSVEELHATIPRFRDVFISEGEKLQLAIFTRTGGDNRTEYDACDAEEMYEPNNHTLRAIAGYDRDEDWPLDSTYAIFYYDVCDDMVEIMKEILEAARKHTFLQHPTDKMNAAFEELKS